MKNYYKLICLKQQNLKLIHKCSYIFYIRSWKSEIKPTQLIIRMNTFQKRKDPRLSFLDGSKIFSYSKSISQRFKFKMHQQSISIYCSDKGYDARMTHSLSQLTRINKEKRFPERKVVDQEVNETLYRSFKLKETDPRCHALYVSHMRPPYP